MLFLVSVQWVQPAEASGTVDFSIWLEGPAEAAPGETIAYTIQTDATGLYGVEFDINFDPAVLQVVGTELTPGDCPVPDYFAENKVDNNAGKISYAVISTNPTPPCDGGTVASFQFQVSGTAAAGNTAVQFDEVILADNNGMEIPATAVALDLEIVGKVFDYNLYLPVILADYP